MRKILGISSVDISKFISSDSQKNILYQDKFKEIVTNIFLAENLRIKFFGLGKIFLLTVNFI